MNTVKILQFQGTSNQGNFQAAIDEAVSKALKVLSMGGADLRIKWKLIETLGTQGGFLGEQVITVTIEAQSD